MTEDERNRQLMIKSCDAYWQTVRELPAEDAQYGTLLHLWTHARWFVQDEDYAMMILRPLAYIHLVREGCPPKEIMGRLYDCMSELSKALKALEQQRKLKGETSKGANIVLFPKPTE